MRDDALFTFVRELHPRAMVAEVVREGQVVTVTTARPGLLIGKQGAVAEALTAALRERLGADASLKLVETRRPELSAVLMADQVANKLSQGVPLERAVDLQAEQSMRAGALGIAIEVSGCVVRQVSLGALDPARVERFSRRGEVVPPVPFDDDGNELPPAPREGPLPEFRVTVAITSPAEP